MATNPFRGFMDTMSETNRMRQSWMRYPAPGDVHLQGQSQESAWTPEVDVLAEEDNLVVLVDLPGVRPEDVELALSDGLLTISGQRAGRQTGGEHYTPERRSGTFRRSLTFPTGVSESNIDTSLVDGVLEITVEDYAGLSEPRRVEVRGSKERT
ncbi:MAG: Hsp20/alpha crystallin family protein [Rubrobacter sp.]|nr:Hsp20/alpha crystallin family protein [Rubrobacter sp.]